MTQQDTFADKAKTNIRFKLAKLANLRYGNPSKKLVLIGVTGSKGKTVTTNLIYHILNAAGLAAGSISTISAKIGDEDLDTGFHVTSPEPWDLPKYLKRMVRKGIQYVVLETTSNGLQQGRFAGLKFDVSVITNIASDHLDYHVTWENYANAKFKLIDQLVDGGLAVVNNDHISSEWIKDRAEQINKEVLAAWFSKKEVKNWEQTFEGMKFKFNGVDFKVNAFGEHMLENVLAAIKACSRYLTLEEISKAIATFRLPPGRTEVLQHKPYTVIVDFAHTPDSLYRTLESLVELKQHGGRIITVFGCAGDRDPERRRMGEVAAKFSKLVVLTAEDPRRESLTEINSEIFYHAEPMGAVLVERFSDTEEYGAASLENLFGKLDRVIANNDIPVVAFDQMSVQSRIDAIDFALRYAERNDIVVITGKGHERSLNFMGTEFEWSDQYVVKSLLEQLQNEKIETLDK